MDDPMPSETFIAALGKVVDFESFDQAEAILGWRALRPDAPNYTLVRHGGVIRTFPEVGLPRLEQFYAEDGNPGILQFVQEPESYKSTPPPGEVATASIGPWVGKLWKFGNQAGFEFLSGEMAGDQPVRVTVYGDGFTTAEIERFVASLDYSGTPTIFPAR